MGIYKYLRQLTLSRGLTKQKWFKEGDGQVKDQKGTERREGRGQNG